MDSVSAVVSYCLLSPIRSCSLRKAWISPSAASGGEVVTDPLQASRELDPRDAGRIGQFLDSCLPGVSSNRVGHEVCHYTMSPDEHFIVDRHPERENVVFAAGLSGHGFKFASALGKALAELALDGRSSVDTEFLSLGRASLEPFLR